MAFIGQPGGGDSAVAWASQPVVSLFDAGGNVAIGDTSPVTLAVSGAGAALSCTGGLTAAATAGVATFAGCTLDRAGTGYRLTAAAAGLPTATSVSFAISSGPPVRLGFTAQPGGGTGGQPWATQPVVALQDEGGNTVTTSGLVVTLSLTSNPAGGTFVCNGGESRVTSSGVAAFTGCSIDRVGTGLRLTASVAGGGMADAVSTTFNVVVGPVARLAFELQPGGGTGGVAWPVQPVVVAADAGGNATTARDHDHAGARAGQRPRRCDARLRGGRLACGGGRALHLLRLRDRPGGRRIRLRATAPGLADGVSATVSVIPGPPARVAFSVQPGGGAAGVAWPVQPSLHLPGRWREHRGRPWHTGHAGSRRQPGRGHAGLRRRHDRRAGRRGRGIHRVRGGSRGVGVRGAGRGGGSLGRRQHPLRDRPGRGCPAGLRDGPGCGDGWLHVRDPADRPDRGRLGQRGERQRDRRDPGAGRQRRPAPPSRATEGPPARRPRVWPSSAAAPSTASGRRTP